MAAMGDPRFNFSRTDAGGNNGHQLHPPPSEKTKDEELLHMRRQMDQLQQRVHILEKMNLNSEARLEDQSKQCLAAEKRCDDIQAEADRREEQLHKEIEKITIKYEEEKQRGERFREQLSRTEREMYGILQRRYEGMRGPNMKKAPNAGMLQSGSSKNGGHNNNNDGYGDDGGGGRGDGGKSGGGGGNKDTARTRERKVMASLSQFLGF
jgi:hypothetical protein